MKSFLLSWNVHQRTTYMCQTTSLEPSKLEINMEENSTWWNIHFCGFSRFWMNVSLYLEITEWKLVVAMLKLSMEPGLAKTVARWKFLQCPCSELSWEIGSYKRNLLAVDSISPCQQLLTYFLMKHPFSHPYGSKVLTSSTVSIFWQAAHSGLKLFWNHFPSSSDFRMKLLPCKCSPGGLSLRRSLTRHI